MRVQIEEEITSCGSDPLITLFTLHTDIPEDELHLILVGFSQVLPQLDNNWFEVTINVVSFRCWLLLRGRDVALTALDWISHCTET